MKNFALDEIINIFGKERIRSLSPDYFEILGTDRGEDANLLFGSAFIEYRKAWKDNPANQIVGEFPLHLDVEVTNTCNLRCSMCQIPFREMERGFMEFKLYKKIICEIKKHELPSIKFNFRGEPLRNPAITEFVKLAKEAGILEVQFNSNGALLNENLSEALIKAGLDRIKFSVDSIIPEKYNEIRRGAKYDKTVDNILEFIEIRNRLGKKLPSVQVQMVLMDSNKSEVSKYIEFWQDKVNRIGFSRYRAGNNRIGETGRVEMTTQRFPCHQLWQRLVVLWDGTVLMCCGDHHALNPIGNVKQQSIAEIWKSEELNTIRKCHLQNKYDEILPCVDCEVNYK